MSNDIDVSTKYEKHSYWMRLVIAVCSVLIFLVVLISAIIIVPRAVRLMNTAQRTLNNIESVSEDLKALDFAETIKSVDENTAQAMADVSEAMKKLNDLDIDSLNQSINELKESTEKFSSLFN